MAPKITRQLLAGNAPVALSVSKEEADKVSIKGFASIERLDRSGDLVPPEEFNINQFMVNPQLLVDHKLWTDQMGNGVAVGRPTSAHAAKLVNLDDDLWSIVDLKTGNQINTFPKAKVPDLKVGDRGLFIVAEVTIPEVAKMVKSAELSTFSWRGFVEVDHRVNDKGTVDKILRNIDLLEVSLTHIPDNPRSAFVIGKSVGGVEVPECPYVVHSMRLDKGRFETSAIALEYLKAHNLGHDKVREDEISFFALQTTEVDLSKLITIKMSEGVYAISGPEKPESYDSWLATEVSQSLVQKLSSLYEESEMSKDTLQEEVDAKEAAKAVHQGDCPEGQHMVDGQCVPIAKSKEVDALAHLGDAIAAKTVEGLTPAFEKLALTFSESITGMTEAIQKMAPVGAPAKEPETDTKPETDTDTEKKSDTEKAMVLMMDKLNGLAVDLQTKKSELADHQSQLAEVAKAAIALQKVTPEPTTRDEKVPTSKAAEKDDADPNACFDSTMPFIR